MGQRKSHHHPFFFCEHAPDSSGDAAFEAYGKIVRQTDLTSIM